MVPILILGVLAMSCYLSVAIVVPARAITTGSRPCILSARHPIILRRTPWKNEKRPTGAMFYPLHMTYDSDEEVNGGPDAMPTSIVEAPSDVEEASTFGATSNTDDSDSTPFLSTYDASFSPQSSSTVERNLLFMQSLGAITSRGEFASSEQMASAMETIRAIEKDNPIFQPTFSPKIRGRWELVFSSAQLFRSSPFFLAGRATCTTPDQAAQYNWFCSLHRQALAISTIGPVRQIVSDTTLTHEFCVQAGAIPFLQDLTGRSYSGGLPIAVEGVIISIADVTPIDNGTQWELFMDTVEIKGSNVPGIRQILDAGLKFPSRQLGKLLEQQNVVPYTNPKPVFRTTYLDDQFRIGRDQDNNAFIYVKTSIDESPTDFSNVDSDLNLARLLEGFNDNVLKFFL